MSEAVGAWGWLVLALAAVASALGLWWRGRARAAPQKAADKAETRAATVREQATAKTAVAAAHAVEVDAAAQATIDELNRTPDEDLAARGNAIFGRKPAPRDPK